MYVCSMCDTESIRVSYDGLEAPEKYNAVNLILIVGRVLDICDTGDAVVVAYELL